MPVTSKTRIAVLAAGALGLALAGTAAAAQDYPDDSYSGDANYAGDDSYSDDANGEEVVVTAPRFEQAPNAHPGMEGRVYLSHAVTYADLDLRSRRDARELRRRVRETASGICYELDEALPGTGDDHNSCYRNAVNRGIAQARAAVYRARYSEDE